MILRNCVKNLNVKHIISSKIEHHAVTHTIDYLLTCNDIKISYVKIHSNGNIDYDDLENILEGSSEKTLVSLMHINNELGNISNIKLISDLCKKHNALFHSDTVQSIGHYDLDFNKLKLDFFVASAHKFHGPKGVGFVFVRKNTRLGSFITGTESVHNIYGMSEALKISLKNLVNEKKYVTDIKNYFITNISNEIKGVKFNGTSGKIDKSTYTLVNVLLPIDKKTGGLLMFKLDMKGIACSKGSACQSGSDNGSHVLNEIQNKQDNENISLRFSFSIFNTKKDIDYTILELKKLIL